MRTIAIQIIMIQVLLCCVSCEKDFIYDEDCLKKGGQIGKWEEHKDTTITEPKDTTSGFYIKLNEWGDTIHKNILI